MRTKLSCSCNVCAAATIHSVRLVDDQFLEASSDYQQVEVIICDGCRSVSLRTTSVVSANRTLVSFEPPRLRLFPKDWLRKIAKRDPVLYGLMNEVYRGATERTSRLFVMGLRAALDHLMTQMVGDVGGFAAKLAKLEDQGFISKKQRELLDILIDGASATAHRGYLPKWPFIEQMALRIENLIQEHYISGPEVAKLKDKIPTR